MRPNQIEKTIAMSRLVLAAAAAAAAIVSAPTAGADPAQDVLCHTNMAFAQGHSSICADAKNPLGDQPVLGD